jgi:hypothetical protein
VERAHHCLAFPHVPFTALDAGIAEPPTLPFGYPVVLKVSRRRSGTNPMWAASCSAFGMLRRSRAILCHRFVEGFLTLAVTGAPHVATVRQCVASTIHGRREPHAAEGTQNRIGDRPRRRAYSPTDQNMR